MPYKFIFATAMLFGVIVDCHAITNIESKRTREEVNGVKGEVEFAFSGKSGNSDEQSTEASFRLDYRQQQRQMLGILSYEREKTNDVETTDNAFAHLRYIHHRSDVFAWEGYTQYQQDAFKSLDSRLLLGAGARLNVSPQDESYLLTLGLGAYYTEETYDLEGGSLHENYVRANTYASFVKSLGENITFSNTLYWQPRFSRPSDSYIYNNLEFKMAINTALSLKITIESQYDSDPVEDVSSTDHSYYTSLVYEF
ncbi:MAG: DUF481 domain-containing protein [Spongiibacteraceae bacterium]